MKNWFSRLYDWLTKLSETKMGAFALFACAFADASFLPLPVTTFFLVLIMLNTRMIYKYVFFVILGTLTGALVGYSAGHYVWIKPDGEFTGVVKFLFTNIPGFSVSVYNKVHILFAKWNFLILCAATVTPLPYGMFSVTAGVFDINIFTFLFTTLVCQTMKFSFLTLITTKLGPDLKRIIKFSWKPISIFSAAVLLVILVSNVL
jgi:membrane protein YqaA with SNARE-associated domain